MFEPEQLFLNQNELQPENTYNDLLFISFPLGQAQTIPSPNNSLLLPNSFTTFQD